MFMHTYMLVLEWKERVFIEKVNSRCFCWFLVAILVDLNGPPKWRLRTKLYKGVWNVSANNSATVGHKDLRLGQVVYILVFYNISFCCLLPLDSFQFIFSLHGSLSRYIVEVKFPQILFEWANVYANVKVLQVRLQHSPDLKENAKIVSLLPFQRLLYMIVFKYCSLCYLILCSSRKYLYPPPTEGTFA